MSNESLLADNKNKKLYFFFNLLRIKSAISQDRKVRLIYNLVFKYFLNQNFPRYHRQKLFAIYYQSVFFFIYWLC